MGCPAEVVFGTSFPVSICTHDPDTGALSDADEAPTFRLYSGVSSLTMVGTLALADDDNMDGSYWKEIACTAENGFAVNRYYTIFIFATVDSDTGGISHTFRVKAASDGPGEDEVTLTFTVDGAPVADASVWVTADADGDYRVAGPLETNSLGKATFLLNAGLTYYAWMQKDGCNPIVGEAFTAVAD